MEDISIKYDNTARVSTGSIYQFVYGDNGINSIKQYSYDFDLLTMNNEKIKNLIHFTNKSDYDDKYDNDKYCDSLIKLRDRFRNIFK
jgi:hypothetical protein